METVTQNDLKEIKQMISELAQTQQKQFEKLDQKVSDLKVEIAAIKEGQNSINKRLDDTKSDISKRLDDTKSDISKRLDDTKSDISKRLDDSRFDVSKRLDNLDFIARTVIGGVILALIVSLVKVLYPELTI